MEAKMVVSRSPIRLGDRDVSLHFSPTPFATRCNKLQRRATNDNSRQNVPSRPPSGASHTSAPAQRGPQEGGEPGDQRRQRQRVASASSPSRRRIFLP